MQRKQTHPAKIIQSTDGETDGYKNGWIKCQACGWKKELGDGFLRTVIETCAKCDPTVSTHTQTEVTVGSPGHYTIYHGQFEYMHTERICVQIKRRVLRTEHTAHVPR